MTQQKYLLLLFFLALPLLALGASAVWPGSGIGWIVLLVGALVAVPIYWRTREQGGPQIRPRSINDTSPNPEEELKSWQEAQKKKRD